MCPSIPDTRPYNATAMAGRPPTSEAPAFGARLAAARKHRGLTQRELADRIGITREMIGYYERRAANPSVGFIERAAEALDVPVTELVGRAPTSTRAKRGPVSVLDARIDEVKKLPRKEQEFVMKFLETVIERAKAS